MTASRGTPAAGWKNRWLGRVALCLLLVATLGTIADSAPASAAERALYPVETVEAGNGLSAWLLQDHTVPVIAVHFAFRGGRSLDPPGKDGLAGMMTRLLVEGAGPLDSQAFQARLEDRAIKLGFAADKDYLHGSVRFLTTDLDEAATLTNLALTAPRFDAADVERVRAERIVAVRRNLADPFWQAQRRWQEAFFGDHPYARPAIGTLESLAAIDADDLRAFARDRLAREGLAIAICGDIDAAGAADLINRLFSGLPEQPAVAADIPPFTPHAVGETLIVPFDTPQSVVMMGHGGITRDDPDWIPAAVMNYVLGGGGFSSRLMQEAREKRGLTYGVSSNIVSLEAGGMMLASGSVANEKAGAFVDVLRTEWERMHDEGVTEQELADAKTYLTGSFPLQFTSTGAIASLLLHYRLEHLGVDYVNRRNALIEAVTTEDVARVARRLLAPADLTVVVAGQPEGVAATSDPAAAPAG